MFRNVIILLMLLLGALIGVALSSLSCANRLPDPLPPISKEEARCEELQKYLDQKDCGIDVIPACRDYAHVGMHMPACAYSAKSCQEAMTCQ